jgi:hypothetical protein
LAAEKGLEGVCAELLQYRADANAKNRRGKAAWELSVLGGHGEVLKVLLAAGVDVDAKDGDQDTPLHLAAKTGSAAMCAELLEHGADANTQAGQYGMTPAHLAAEGGRGEALKVLLAAGVDVKAKRNDGITPAHLAGVHKHKEALKLLMAASAVVNSVYDGLPPERKNVALLGAAERGESAKACDHRPRRRQLPQLARQHPDALCSVGGPHGSHVGAARRRGRGRPEGQLWQHPLARRRALREGGGGGAAAAVRPVLPSPLAPRRPAGAGNR